jgi:hypothetical protein
MSAPTLRITVIPLGGDAQTVEVSAHDTARSLLTHTAIDLPARARPLFLTNGSVLQPDFTLASQGITTGTEVRVMVQKQPIPASQRAAKTSSEEVLRLADVSFRRFEMARSQRRMALRLQSLSRRPAAVRGIDLFATKIVAAVDISEDPLPSAWREAVEDSDFEHPRGL